MDGQANLEQRDKRGDWRPDYQFTPPPIYAWPPKPISVAKWLLGYPGFLWPWTFFYISIATLVWLFLTPSLDSMRTFAVWWVVAIFLRNIGLVMAYFGVWHLYLYIKRYQGLKFKYSGKWLETNAPKFLFRNQTQDNIFWTLCSAVPIWTAYEVITMWAFSNNIIPHINLRDHPIYFVGLMLLTVPIHETHFYFAHRLLHWQPIYRRVHYLHHKNINIGPWSGLSMHPIEHLIFFSAVFLHWVLPSHPLIALLQLQVAGLSPAQGHAGFDEVIVGKQNIKTGCYFHYLHHKFFEVNYGSDGVVVLDKIFGTFHDGTSEGQEAIKRKRATRSARKLKA